MLSNRMDLPSERDSVMAGAATSLAESTGPHMNL